MKANKEGISTRLVPTDVQVEADLIRTAQLEAEGLAVLKGLTEHADLHGEFPAEVNLAGLKIPPLPRRAFLERLEKDGGVKTLNLSQMGMDNGDGIYISKALKANKTISSLDLSSNKFGTYTASILGESLSVNETLERLDLSDNPRLTDGGSCDTGNTQNGIEKFAEGLGDNQSLKWLDMSFDGVDALGGQHLVEALRKRRQALDIFAEPGNHLTNQQVNVLASFRIEKGDGGIGALIDRFDVSAVLKQKKKDTEKAEAEKKQNEKEEKENAAKAKALPQSAPKEGEDSSSSPADPPAAATDQPGDAEGEQTEGGEQRTEEADKADETDMEKVKRSVDKMFALPEWKAMLERGFQHYDIDGSGQMDTKEMKKAMATLQKGIVNDYFPEVKLPPVDDELVEKSMKVFDANENGTLSLTEYAAFSDSYLGGLIVKGAEEYEKAEKSLGPVIEKIVLRTSQLQAATKTQKAAEAEAKREGGSASRPNPNSKKEPKQPKKKPEE
uniref:EF-hand domain-containing protein n=1 Tax=Chromera velia CCMP2878 TaxID=1169474 RepID=A0A0G4F098_9ALVE|eukprot:Cvel_2605.t1-p1 / transcript=Cvel_2605.t1 / gene=Cvel_2605 / organism=Chromera_velia_CCMP2878 / gene_product=Protein NLRC3, putative / transcript_product=Protein NLRC3, putative / location=Cvel_scaffold103:28549-31227(+) / protein_length=499 / sequence_SO=supercontig / SO=protein_coding / is_pseudo=false